MTELARTDYKVDVLNDLVEIELTLEEEGYLFNYYIYVKDLDMLE